MNIKVFTLVACFICAPSFAQDTVQTPNTALGVDYAIPYTLLAGSTTVTQRANMNVGVDYRLYLSDSINVGSRIALDIEEQPGTVRQYSFAPGIQYHWFQGHTWMPYIRSDLPFAFHGAVNSTGNSDQVDLGFAFGMGVAWNLGNQIGIDHLVFRYDFGFSYMFGLSDAIKVLNLEFLKIGAEYRF